MENFDTTMSSTDISSTMRTTTKKDHHICGVNQCSQRRGPGITLHRLPKKVMENRKTLLMWKVALRMGKPFPKHFLICSRHFKNEHIRYPTQKSRQNKNGQLLNSAFPTLNLPRSSLSLRKATETKARQQKLKNRGKKKEQNEELHIQNICESFPQNDNEIETPSSLNDITCKQYNSTGCQTIIHKADKSTQVGQNEEISFNYIPFQIFPDEKLNTMTGIPTNEFLETLVKFCLILRPTEASNVKGFSIRNKIILTMYRIKNNATNFHIAALFKLSVKASKNYFTDCVQLLSKVLSCFIYWPSSQEYAKNLPRCFEKFPNVVTVLDCTEIKTVQFRCLKCKCCTYSHYKGTHTVKILVGITPSGLVNFISPSVSGRTSDKAIFNLTGLIKFLKPGDAVMVDKGFMIANELLEAGVEMIRPQFMNPNREKHDVEKDRLIAAARVHIERRFSRIKQYKMLSEKVTQSMLPYFDDIVTVVCAISNLTHPILDDKRF